jgi:hypothetical protein
MCGPICGLSESSVKTVWRKLAWLPLAGVLPLLGLGRAPSATLTAPAPIVPIAARVFASCNQPLGSPDSGGLVTQFTIQPLSAAPTSGSLTNGALRDRTWLEGDVNRLAHPVSLRFSHWSRYTTPR